jgi:hypothetical protein
MVTPIPGFSWEEHYGPQRDHELATKIVETLENLLRQRCDAPPSLFIAAPNPGLWDVVEAQLADLVLLNDSFYTVTRRKRPNAYATADRRVFEKLLPFFFRSGPPETALLVVAGLDPGISRADFGDLITRMIRGVDFAPPPHFVVMYFDSGDLMSQR